MTDTNNETLSVAADAPFFAGHFPGNPIVPGAYLLARVVECAAKRYENTGAFEVASAKFLNMVRPGEEVTLQFAGNPPSLKFSLHVRQQVVVSGALKITGNPPL